MQTDTIKAQIAELSTELTKYANYITRNTTLSGDDLVQDVIVKVLKSEKVFTENDNLRAYLYQAIRNTFINQNIRAGRNASLASKAYDYEGEGSAQSHDEAIASLLSSPSAEDQVLNGVSPAIEEALKMLDSRIRETIVLVDLNAYSYEEAAEALNIKIGTVMSRLHRGRKYLREILVTREGALA